MKKGYVKDNWTIILVTAAFIIVAGYMRDVVSVVVAVVFTAALVVNYRNFDETEKMYNDWWNNLAIEDKGKVYVSNNEEKS
jgi:uncharacterized membrane protein YphA (DoxX/SURF4 family)